jgi:transcriptional regulator with XRE-family HTH domain
MQNEKFGRLLKGAINSIAAYERKTAPIIEEELGQQVGVSAASIQRYKAGHIPPEANTVQTLAERVVKRGYLNRDWLQNFLQAARYPFPDQIIARHYPPLTVAQPATGERIYHNLPAPAYSQFVMREQAFGDVLDGLSQRNAVVVISSLGGMGKTSLAREVAAHCLTPSSVPQFDAAVWISDKDQPGTTTLDKVQDEITITLDYPGFTHYAAPEKKREVEQLLRRVRTLVVVDNYETIADDGLLVWLLRLPEPSKALITTREHRKEFRRGAWHVELRGMTAQEAHELIGQRARMLKVELATPEQLAPLVQLTGGNAKALELALGCLKYEKRPLGEVVTAFATGQNELFADLFSRCWALLDEPAQNILRAMPFFPAGATRAALSHVSGYADGTFDRALEQLTDLTLLDAYADCIESQPRYALHPLVQAYARARLDDAPEMTQVLRRRWLDWYIGLAESVGYCWNDATRLEKLDAEGENIQHVLEWALGQGFYADTLRLTKGVGYYYYVRGLWERKPPINLITVEAARKLGAKVQEIEGLAYHLQVLSKQGNLTEAAIVRDELAGLVQNVRLPGEPAFVYGHALALYDLARGEYDAAWEGWHGLIELAGQVSAHHFIIVRQWLGICSYLLHNAAQAALWFGGALSESVNYDYKQGIVANLIGLSDIDLDNGDLTIAAERLSQARQYATRYKYRDHQAQIERLTARLATLQGNPHEAAEALHAALDLFERLGMRRELNETHTELLVLNVQHTSTTAKAGKIE